MRTGIVVGAFDLFHAGHVHLLKQAKKHCDYLVVGLHIDPSVERPLKNKPVESVFEREIRLRGCRYVDDIITYETERDLKNILKYFNPSVRFLGSEYVEKHKNKPVTELNAVPVVYIDSLPIHTSDLRKRVKEATK